MCEEKFVPVWEEKDGKVLMSTPAHDTFMVWDAYTDAAVKPLKALAEALVAQGTYPVDSCLVDLYCTRETGPSVIVSFKFVGYFDSRGNVVNLVLKPGKYPEIERYGEYGNEVLAVYNCATFGAFTYVASRMPALMADSAELQHFVSKIADECNVSEDLVRDCIRERVDTTR